MAKKDKKTFWEGKFWQTLKAKAPDVAGTVLKTAGNLTGVELLNKAGELIDGPDAPKLTPEEKVELLELQRIELDQQRLDNEDRASARQREVNFVQAVGRDWFMYVVGFVILVITAYMIWHVLSFPVQDNTVAHILIGEVMGMTTGIVVYYFGSSRGSKDKQRTIDKLTKKE